MAVANSNIEWTDSTWSPVTEGIARRFAGSKAFPNGFDVTLHPERLDQPLKWRKPRRIFVNSMSDLFHDAVPDDYIAHVFAVMAEARHHTFQVLTKRHGRMRSLLNSEDFQRQVWGIPDLTGWQWPIPNVWLGVSVEDQKRADLRIPALLGTPAAVRWISAEPLLGPVDLDRHLFPGACPEGCGCRRLDDADTRDCGCDGPCTSAEWNPDPGLHWVVAGGESGHGARPMHPDWPRDLQHQCTTAAIPFLFKQWGAWAPTRFVGIGNQGPRFAYVGEPVDGNGHRTVMERVGKKVAGRELDGRTWDEYPQEVSVHG